MRCAIRRSLRVREPIASCPRFLTNSLILTINATPSANRELRLPHPPSRGKVTSHANPDRQSHRLDRAEARASATDPRGAADRRLAAERVAGAAQARPGNRGTAKTDCRTAYRARREKRRDRSRPSTVAPAGDACGAGAHVG